MISYEVEKLKTGVRWMSVIRIILSIICVIVLILQISSKPLIENLFSTLLALLALPVAFSIIYLVIHDFVKNYLRFVKIQIAIDLIVISFLVYLTGGFGSSFVLLYLAALLAASTLINSFAIITIYALLATLMLATVYALNYSGYSAEYFFSEKEAFAPSLTVSLGYLIIHSAGFHLVALLGGMLAARSTAVRILNDEILQNMSEGLLVIDANEKITFINYEAIRILGLSDINNISDSHLKGRSINEILKPGLYELLSPLINNRETKRMVLDLPRNEFLPLPIEAKTSILKTPSGYYRGLIIIMGDLSVHRKMEEAVKRAERFEVIGEAAAGIAHEIRNPLASIRGAVQELFHKYSQRQNVDDDTDVTTLKNIIIKESDRMDNIITEFLKFARMRPARLEPIKLNKIINDVIMLLQKRKNDKKVNIIANMPEDIFIEGDEEQLTQVFLNLGINAIDFSPDNGNIKINMKNEQSLMPIDSFSSWDTDLRYVPNTAKQAVITIEDEGPGVPETLQSEIFKPFVTSKPAGTGMGLSVVERIVSSHKGTINVSNISGGGARFTIIFPVEPDIDKT